MVRTRVKLKPVDFKTRRKSRTVPNQSLSIKEIVARYVRGLPADVQIKQGVYMEQHAHDFNKLSMMDSADKAFMAGEMRDRVEQLGSQIEADKRAYAEAQEQKKADEKARLEEERTGIGSLDNTMPDDTGTDRQTVSRGRNRKS